MLPSVLLRHCASVAKGEARLCRVCFSLKSLVSILAYYLYHTVTNITFIVVLVAGLQPVICYKLKQEYMPSWVKTGGRLSVLVDLSRPGRGWQEMLHMSSISCEYGCDHTLICVFKYCDRSLATNLSKGNNSTYYDMLLYIFIQYNHLQSKRYRIHAW